MICHPSVLDIPVHTFRSMTRAKQEITTEVQRSAIVARQVACFQIVLCSSFFSQILPFPFLSTAFLPDSASVLPSWKFSACISHLLYSPLSGVPEATSRRYPTSNPSHIPYLTRTSPSNTQFLLFISFNLSYNILTDFATYLHQGIHQPQTKAGNTIPFLRWSRFLLHTPHFLPPSLLSI